MSDTLTQIIAYKREEVRAAKAAIALLDLEEKARAAGPVRGFGDALVTRAKAGGVALIAEIKKASPSKGLIRADFDPVSLARAYEDGGATCLSVLTDTPSFQGRDDYLAAARNAVSLPALRKDFMIDPWQIVQSRALGADAILIIMAAVDDALARELFSAATDWGMDALIECHDDAEVTRALALGADLIGVNNRCLRSFETRLETTEILAPRILAAGRFLVAESGIATNQDVARLQKAGASAFLVGESLMRKPDVASATRALLQR
jgi:indole-3-glycerol phosphate synthase